MDLCIREAVDVEASQTEVSPFNTADDGMVEVELVLHLDGMLPCR